MNVMDYMMPLMYVSFSYLSNSNTLYIPEAGETAEAPVKRYCNTGLVPIRTQNQDGCAHTR